MPPGPRLPPQKKPALGSFVVKNSFADFKRHDFGRNFHERNFKGTTQKLFMAEPLWGVGTSAPYGHDGRSLDPISAKVCSYQAVYRKLDPNLDSGAYRLFLKRGGEGKAPGVGRRFFTARAPWKMG